MRILIPFTLVYFYFIASLLADICIPPYSPERFSPEMARKAEEGDAYAQSQLGYCYEKGYGVDKNEIEMIKWYKRACTSGKDMMMIGLGVSPEEIEIRTSAKVKSHIYEENVNKLVWGHETPGLKYPAKILDASSRDRMYSFFREKPNKCIWLRYDHSESSFRDLNLNPKDAYRIIAMSFGNSGVEMKVDKTFGLKNDIPLDYTWAIYLKGPNGESAEASVEFNKNLIPTFSVTCASADYNTYEAQVALPEQESKVEQSPVRAIADLTKKRIRDGSQVERNNSTQINRLSQCIYYLTKAENEGFKPELILEESSKLNGTYGTSYSEAVKECLLENLALANLYGLVEPKNMVLMKKGENPNITKGDYTGQIAKEKSIIPPTITSELADQIFNLQIVPESYTINKEEQVKYAKKLYDISVKWSLSYSPQAHRHEEKSDQAVLSQKGLDAVLSSFDNSIEHSNKTQALEAPKTDTEQHESYKLLEKIVYEQANKANATKSTKDIREFNGIMQKALEAFELMIRESLKRQGIKIDAEINHKIELATNDVRNYLKGLLSSDVRNIRSSMY